MVHSILNSLIYAILCLRLIFLTSEVVWWSIFGRNELEFSTTRHLKNSWNENRSVQIGRAGQVWCTCTSVSVQQVFSVVQ